MNKDRLKYLIEKYKQNRLHRSEYLELLSLLNKPDSEKNLDQLLTHYWKDSAQTTIPIQPSDADDRPNASSYQSPGIDTSTPVIAVPRTQRLNDSTTQRYYWGIAASLLLLIGFFLYQGISPKILGTKEIVYSTGYGERLEVELNDGSRITLNANSEIRWSENWEKQRNRQITLEGEAFFEVEKQDGIPFTVHTNDVAVEVLGTSFNVDTREEKTEVYLEEGKVNLKLLGVQDTKENDPDTEIILKPGDQVKYNAKEGKVEKSEGQNIITAASWKNNVLNFKNMKFSEVLDLLREIYGQSFECTDGKLLNTPMYIGVPYSDWEAVRQALELSLNIEFLKVETRRYSVRNTKKTN